MKLLKWTDEEGYIRHSLVRDNDTNPKLGIPHDPPDLTGLELDGELQKELHNKLAESNLFTHLDVLNSGSGVTNVLTRLGLKHLRREVLMYYKLEKIGA